MPPKATQPAPATPARAPRPAPPLPLPANMHQWHGNETNPVRLRVLLTDPVMQAALALLLERARPTQRGIADPNANATSLLGWYAGYCDAIHDLRHTLTRPAAAHETGSLIPDTRGGTHSGVADSDEPWSYLVPDGYAPDSAN